ncbi:MAG: hypothetical protein UH239_05805 [Acutalibacteraceae bacterium]|nr:hypothetical protein [Acutalibacteraceae bacterium]
MAFIDTQLITLKNMIEDSIRTGGVKGKESMIRSSALINLVHDAVKFELQAQGVNPDNIFPHFEKSKPEIKLAGLLKQKNQDVCVIPSNVRKYKTEINWGPMAFQNKTDPYGFEFSTNTLVINIRSQMSSLAKNADTLFERTFAEALNLHMKYPDIVLGEVYLIPTHEYDDVAVSNYQVAFKSRQTDIEKYISFFNSINNRRTDREEYMYERCALLIVDFRANVPKIFRSSDELKSAGLISNDFPIEYKNLSFDNFAEDILNIYGQRYDIKNMMC